MDRGAAALFTAVAAGAAWAATRQVKAASDEERRLRILAHLQVIHDLVSDLVLITPLRLPSDRRRWERPQLNLRCEVTVVFSPLPKRGELAGADLWTMDEAAYPKLVSEAMAEVETAMVDIWEGRPALVVVSSPPGRSNLYTRRDATGPLRDAVHSLATRRCTSARDGQGTSSTTPALRLESGSRRG